MLGFGRLEEDYVLVPGYVILFFAIHEFPLLLRQLHGEELLTVLGNFHQPALTTK